MPFTALIPALKSQAQSPRTPSLLLSRQAREQTLPYSQMTQGMLIDGPESILYAVREQGHTFDSYFMLYKFLIFLGPPQLAIPIRDSVYPASVYSLNSAFMPSLLPLPPRGGGVKGSSRFFYAFCL